MKHIKYILFLSLIIPTLFEAIDLVVFSYNRPMQLYAFLESVEKYISGISSTNIILRASSVKYKDAYQVVQNRFAWANFVYQVNPPHDFKRLVMEAAFSKENSNYILFAVDDIIVKDHVNLIYCASLLEKHQTYNLMLRLGKNINYCYSMDINTPVPVAVEVEKGLYKYTVSQGMGDWGYPNNVDMTIYRKKDIYSNLADLDWKNPNQMEGAWAGKADLDQKSLFFELSKIINIPLNIVGVYKQNRSMQSYSEVELLEKFEQGLRIDIEYFYRIINNSAHVEYEIYFK